MSYLEIALAGSVRHTLFYLPPAGADGASLRPGQRMQVPVGRHKRVGVLVAICDSTPIEHKRLRRVLAVLDDEPLFGEQDMALMQWAARYYHYPIGEVLAGAMPALLRQGRSKQPEREQFWRLTEAGAAVDPRALGRAVRQIKLLEKLREYPDGLASAELTAVVDSAGSVLKTLGERGWVQMFKTKAVGTAARHARQMQSAPDLLPDQRAATEAVLATLATFSPFVLDGVTGSGKTEVYLQIMAKVIADGGQALLLLPEIGLTPQMVQRIEARFTEPIAVFHSGMTDTQRLQSWLMARSGKARIVVGTRSAVWTPMPDLGFIVVDEEHDRSFKQHEGFRYNARDIAVLRAQRNNIPVILGSATPSLESLYNVDVGRYQKLHLPERAGNAGHPSMHILDVRSQVMFGNLSAPLLAAMRRHLEAGTQVMLFLNRRGFAPVLMCHDCGWTAQCRHCDANLTVHGTSKLWCHHCGATRSPQLQCPDCGSDALLSVGYGTQRVEQVLAEQFPDHTTVRIDRDSVSRKGSFERILERIHGGDADILLGTQMLAKGHHFPRVTLVGIVDADAGLFSTEFRATEEMAQLIIQTAGRGGREDYPGEVVVQTHHPDHPLLNLLITSGYSSFATAALAERKEAGLPPFGYLAMLRADSPRPGASRQFLARALEVIAGSVSGVSLFGPVPAPMPKRAGRYREQLLLQSQTRSDLQRFLSRWMPCVAGLKTTGSVRWSIDVDPISML